MKKILAYFLVPAIFLFSSLSFSLRASATPAVAVDGAMEVMEVLNLLQDFGLINIDPEAESIYMNDYSLLMSGHSIPIIAIGNALSWLDTLFNDSNQLFWSTDNEPLQLHNGEFVPVKDVSDIWFISDNCKNNSRIPVNYVAQSSGFPDYITTSNNFELCTVADFSKLVTNTSTLWLLPLCSSGDNFCFSSIFLEFSQLSSGATYYTPISSTSLSASGTSQIILTLSSSGYHYLSVGTSASSTSFVQRSSYKDNATNSSGIIQIDSSGPLPYSDFIWLDSQSAEAVTLSSGDVSFLFYTNTPVYVPSDFPSGNYVYTTDPSDSTSTVIVSPYGDYGSFIDFLLNGFKFTGTVEQTITSTISFSGSVSADITHGGSITINFNDDLNIWADDGSATDFGNGVSLDGNAFNDGFKWLLDGIKSVPVLFSSFSFIPASVISVITAALVVMVFLGLWRTFKG